MSLTNIEFRILYVLALHHGSILFKEQIYNFVWNGEYLRKEIHSVSKMRTQAIGCICKHKSTVGYPDKEP